MRVIVTGANGLLGAHLVRELLADGHEVRALVRETSDLRALEGLAVDRAYGDVRDPRAMREAAAGCELLFHAAALFAYWGYSREEMFTTAREGALNAVDAAAEAGVRRMVLTSSTAVFGGRDEPEQLDESAGYASDAVPDYFTTKILQEQTALERARERGVDLVVANPGMFTGPYDFRPSTSLSFVLSYLTSPVKLTLAGGVSIAAAADVARGHLLLAEKGATLERYILAGENLEWRDAHRMIAELAGVAAPYLRVGRRAALVAATAAELASKLVGRPTPAPHALADQAGRYFWYRSDKAARLGFAPRPARRALAETIAWLLDSPHLPRWRGLTLRPGPEVREARRRLAAGRL